MSDVRYTRRAERVLQGAYREALGMGMGMVDTPHLALALRREIKELDYYGIGVEVGNVVDRAVMNALAEQESVTAVER